MKKAGPGGGGKQKEIDIDKIIARLLEIKDPKQDKSMNLFDWEIFGIVAKAQEIFKSQPIFLELEAPIKICGDIHGQFNDLLKLFEYGGAPPAASYLFLGDYVDRGRHSLEVVILMFCYKIKYPENFFLLRGNHETEEVNKGYGFYDECKRRYNVKTFNIFNQCFCWMPLSALVDNRILCMHGGLSPDLKSLDILHQFQRPLKIPDKGLACDLLWSDPSKETDTWAKSERGVSFTFGVKVLTEIIKKFDLDMVCRAHQVVEDGYQFFGNRQLITVFSAPNYSPTDDNKAAIINVAEDLTCSLQIFESDCVKQPMPGK